MLYFCNPAAVRIFREPPHSTHHMYALKTPTFNNSITFDLLAIYYKSKYFISQ